MSICEQNRLRAGPALTPPAFDPAEYALTPEVREWLGPMLEDATVPGAVAEILRAKRAGARTVAPDEPRALPGRKVVYMASGGGAQSAWLTDAPAAQAGQVPVVSLLGATLLGMGRLQRAPLPRDGGVATLVVLGLSSD